MGLDGILTLSEFRKDGATLGVGMDEEMRNQQTRNAIVLLANHAVFYSKHMMSYPSLTSAPRKVLSDLCEKLEKQLLGWEDIIEADASNVFARVKHKWTAKLSAGNDDLAVCFVMNAYWPKRFLESTKPEYVEFFRNVVLPRMLQQQGMPPAAATALPEPRLPASVPAVLDTPMQMLGAQKRYADASLHRRPAKAARVAY